MRLFHLAQEKIMARFRTFILIALLSAVSSTAALAEGVSYVDESGNIHFASGLNDVPMRFRNQILKPTPGPQTEREYQQKLAEYRRQVAEDEKKKKEALKEAEKFKQKQEKERLRIARQRKKELDKENRIRQHDQDRLADQAEKETRYGGSQGE